MATLIGSISIKIEVDSGRLETGQKRIGRQQEKDAYSRRSSIRPLAVLRKAKLA